MIHTIREILEGLTLTFEVPMLRLNGSHSPSEHELFIRLFLTSGGGW
jgi:hypothetical protein